MSFSELLLRVLLAVALGVNGEATVVGKLEMGAHLGADQHPSTQGHALAVAQTQADAGETCDTVEATDHDCGACSCSCVLLFQALAIDAPVFDTLAIQDRGSILRMPAFAPSEIAPPLRPPIA